MKPWTVTASRVVLQDRWIKVRADDCLTADGREIKPFYVLDYPDWVNVIAVTRDRKVVLVRQYRHGLGDFTLGTVAGILERSDTDPAAGGARELLEETGYSSNDVRLVGSISPNAASHSNRQHIVVALNAERVQAPAKDDTEEVEVVLLSVSEAIKAARSFGIMHATQLSALLVGLMAAGVADMTEVPLGG